MKGKDGAPKGGGKTESNIASTPTRINLGAPPSASIPRMAAASAPSPAAVADARIAISRRGTSSTPDGTGAISGGNDASGEVEDTIALKRGGRVTRIMKGKC